MGPQRSPSTTRCEVPSADQRATPELHRLPAVCGGHIPHGAPVRARLVPQPQIAPVTCGDARRRAATQFGRDPPSIVSGECRVRRPGLVA